MSSTSTFFDYGARPGSDWFRDADGIMTTGKTKDEIKSYTIDWADTLASGETISSVTREASGVTASSPANTTTTTTDVITGTGGELRVKVTTSASRVLERVLRFIDSGTTRLRDYR